MMFGGGTRSERNTGLDPEPVPVMGGGEGSGWSGHDGGAVWRVVWVWCFEYDGFG